MTTATAVLLVAGPFAAWLAYRAGRARGYAEGRVAGTVATLDQVASGLAGRTSAPPSRSAGGADA